MNELAAIIEGLNLAGRSRQKCALATVIKVTGSAYRRPGARMLVFQDGETVGTVSGGCLEQDVVIRANNMLGDGAEHLIVSYDTTRDDEIIFGTGSGCRGTVDIFLQPIEPEAALKLSAQLDTGLHYLDRFVLATIVSASGTIDSKIGECILISPGAAKTISFPDQILTKAIWNTARQALTSQSSFLCLHEMPETTVNVFYDVINAPISLFIFGAGYDAVPLASLAAQIGCRVTVVDDRPAYAKRDRFPGAKEVLHAKCEDLAASDRLSACSAAVVMNHNFRRDLAALSILLRCKTEYIGILGPKQRTKRLLELCQAGPLTAKELERIHAPVGLDIGAQTPAEIALAVLSEIMARRNGSAGGFLKDKDGPIHSRKENIALQEECYPLSVPATVIACHE